MKTTWNVLCTLALLALAIPAAARPPQPELCGIRLGMSESDVAKRLTPIATLAQEPAEKERDEDQQKWTFHRGPYRYLALGMANEQVTWVTAFTRQGERRVAFRSLGPLAEARRTGFYIALWEVPASGTSPAYNLIARGADSVYVSSVSLVGRSAATARARVGELEPR